MPATLLLAFVLVVVASGVHFAALTTAHRVCKPAWPALGMMFWLFLVAVFAHLAEVIIYAAAFMVGERHLALGSFGGLAPETFMDYLYFSIVSYTSLGLGDIFPHGHLRFLTGVEALNGLILIAWTVTYTFYCALARRMGDRP